MSQQKLIAFVGRKRSGKDTAAKCLLAGGYTQIRFADALKNMLRSFLTYAGTPADIIERMIEGDLKEVPATQFHGKTPRFAMQTLGTNFGRNHLGEDVWVRAALAHAKTLPRVVITDARFPNECEAIKAAGGILIRVCRPDLPADPSEPPFFAEEKDLYYAAGLIEGEGCFRSTNRSGRTKSGKAPELRVAIQMTDREPLERLVATIGGKISGPYRDKIRDSKPIFSWSLQRRAEVVAATKALFPLLSPRRQSAAQKLLDADLAFPRGANTNYEHISEQVENLEVDFTIVNNSTIDELKQKVLELGASI